MKKFYLILALTLLNCSGLKEYDDAPTPVGGDVKVRSVFQEVLGKSYDELSGVSVTFSVRVNKDGVIEEVGLSEWTNNEYVNRTIVYAMKEQIRFTSPSKNGKKVKASFEYKFTF
ncbi:MAG: hypothetical protein IPM14_04605 [bacterium]|nr:hypothetical protein [bacterium]